MGEGTKGRRRLAELTDWLGVERVESGRRGYSPRMDLGLVLIVLAIIALIIFIVRR